jgi:glycine oxidase
VKITVVGAGIVGCAVAYELAARGAAVTVVDGRGVGRGATQASAGILAPRIEAHDTALLTLAEAALARYDDFVARVRRDVAADVEYERTGTVQVALGDEEADELARMAERLRADGVSCTLTSGAAARREAALSPAVTATLLVPQHGYTAPDDLTHALSQAAATRGAEFVAARADAVRGADDAARVICGERTIESDAVVVAAGSWSDDVRGNGPRPRTVRPIRGQLLHLRMPGRLAPRVLWGRRCYIVPRRDGSVLVGATVEDVGFDETATAAGVRYLLESATALVPALDAARFESVRVGLRPMTRDELPAIGRSSTMRRVFYATGHYRNGVLLAPLTAALVTDLVLDGREAPELSLTNPARLGL